MADLKAGPYVHRGLGVHAEVPQRPAAYNAAFTRRDDRADAKAGPYAYRKGRTRGRPYRNSAFTRPSEVGETRVLSVDGSRLLPGRSAVFSFVRGRS